MQALCCSMLAAVELVSGMAGGREALRTSSASATCAHLLQALVGVFTELADTHGFHVAALVRTVLQRKVSKPALLMNSRVSHA